MRLSVDYLSFFYVGWILDGCGYVFLVCSIEDVRLVGLSDKYRDPKAFAQYLALKVIYIIYPIILPYYSHTLSL